MADNTTMGSTTDVIRDKDRSGVKTQIVGIDVGIGTGTEALMSTTNQLPVVSRVSSLTLTTGTITTSASVVTATTDIPNCGSVTVVIAGTYAGVNVSFEASLDGTTWVGLIGQRVDSYVIETTSGVLTANTTRAWDFPLPGFAQFRVRATAYTSGTANVGIAPAVNPFEIAPTVGIAQAGTATEAGVTASASSVTLLAANPARRGATIANDTSCTSNLWVRLSSSAAASTSGNYTVILTPGSYYEVPFNYSGQINGIWTNTTGFANITEVT